MNIPSAAAQFSIHECPHTGRQGVTCFPLGLHCWEPTRAKAIAKLRRELRKQGRRTMVGYWCYGIFGDKQRIKVRG